MRSVIISVLGLRISLRIHWISISTPLCGGYVRTSRYKAKLYRRAVPRRDARVARRAIQGPSVH